MDMDEVMAMCKMQPELQRLYNEQQKLIKRERQTEHNLKYPNKPRGKNAHLSLKPIVLNPLAS